MTIYQLHYNANTLWSVLDLDWKEVYNADNIHQAIQYIRDKSGTLYVDPNGDYRYYIEARASFLRVITTLEPDDQGWSDIWPTQEDHYWFYGWTSGHHSTLPRIEFVSVRPLGSGRPMYVCNGHFFYPKDGAYGVWKRAEVPTPPQHIIDSIKEDQK